MASPRPVDLTTVTDSEAVVHATRPDGGVDVHRFAELEPGTAHSLDVPVSDDEGGTVTVTLEVTTLRRPPGELLCRVATVNDVHFGELVAGQVDDLLEGPLRRPAPGEPPYPETMNRAAVGEMEAIEPAAVIVKGDLSLDGAPEEWEAFERCYREPFGDRLHVVRGNHDAYRAQTDYAGDQRIDLPGLTVALVDTVIPEATTGRFTSDSAAWLDDVAGEVDRDPERSVLVLGHHQQWVGTPDGRRSDDYFGLHPDGSDLLDEVCARHPSIIGYSAGHTHRHRRRTMSRSGLPTIEVGCTKDFPGTWAEHRVYEGGVMHVVHRISTPEALRWSESCRHLYADFDIDYETYALGSLDDRCFLFPQRR